jgi:hypothetical protein
MARKVFDGATGHLRDETPAEAAAFDAEIAAGRAEAVPDSVTRRQFYQAAAQMDFITQAEALSAIQSNALPALLTSAIDAMPAADQFAAQCLALGSETVERRSPLLEAVRVQNGWTEARRDSLLTLAATL